MNFNLYIYNICEIKHNKLLHHKSHLKTQR